MALLAVHAASFTLFRDPEATPLLWGKSRREKTVALRFVQVGCRCLALIVLSFMVYHTSMHFVRCPLDPFTRDSIHLDWEREVNQHVVLEREWTWKAQEQAELERGWKREAERHESDVTQRTHEEQLRQARVRADWARETERHAREFQETKRREREERERERQRWQREVQEREQREEDERQRHHMYWGHVEAHTCTTYATREYSAQLMNLPRSWKHPLEACKNTPLEIHGISHSPKTREDRGPGVVIGRWEVNQQEPDCTTFWDGYSDNSCTSPGSGKKHITHKLMNLPEQSDWREFCATTPINFNHMQFPGAEECFTTILGVYGRWEMDDNKC